MHSLEVIKAMNQPGYKPTHTPAIISKPSRRNGLRAEVHADGLVATFVITRSDGHELSLSSRDHSLIEWNGGHIITGHGWVLDPFELLGIMDEFLAQDENAPVRERSSSYRPETFTR